MEYTCVEGILMYDRLMPTAFVKIILILLALSSVASITLNFLILISIWKTPSLHKPSYILIASLALSDFLIGIIGVPLSIVLSKATLGMGWNKPYCIMWKASKGLSYGLATVSLCTLAAISLDRFLAIKLKNAYRTTVTPKRVWMVLATIWVPSFITSFTLFLNLKAEIFEHVLLFFEIGTFVVTSFITICYSMAFRQLKKITSSVSSNVGNNDAPSGINVFKYRKTLKTTFLVFIVILLFYSPYILTDGIFTVLHIDKTTFKSDKEKDFILLVSMLVGASELIVVSNSFVNPLMYLWLMRDIRTAVKTTINKIVNR